MNWNGVQVFGNSYHPYALDVIHGHTQTFGGAFLLSLMDLQVFEPEMLKGTPWVAWMPLDHHNLPPYILQNARKANYVISMSRHTKAELDRYDVDNEYIPCAVDAQVFKPYDMAESREAMKMPADKFVVGMVAMNKGNPSRKAFLQNIGAFAALQKKHGDCVMYLHTADGTRGAPVVNLIDYVTALGLSYGYAGYNEDGKDVIFANQYGLSMGYDPLMMAKLYSSMDVLTAVTMGEGFGIPIIEAQACGTPAIVGDWSAMPENLFSGWKVDKSEAEPIYTELGAYHFLPHMTAIAERMEAAYQMRGNQDYRKRAQAGAQQFDIEKVFHNRWLPALDRIAEKIKTGDPLDKKLDVLL